VQDVFTGVFILVFVGTFATGIWSTYARTRAARRMAVRAGLDPQDAAATALLTPDGLDTTYLVSATRPGYAGTTASPAVLTSSKTVEDRLRELDQLKAEGLVSDEEYAAQHKAIVSTV
jgi:hypothetical protein